MNAPRTLESGRITDGLHSPYGPSSFHRAEACTASVIDIGLLPEPPETEWAAVGNLCHLVLERCLQDGTEPFEFIGDVHFGVEFDLDMADMMEWVVEIARAGVSMGQDAHYEVRLHLPNTPMFGTADILIHGVKGALVQVMDLKSGYLPVEGNAVQLALYALMALLNDADLHRQYRSALPDQIVARTTILQPKRGGSKVHDWTAAELRAVEARAHKLIEEVENRVWRWAAGDHCRYCKRLALCPHLKQLAEERAGMDLPTEMTAEILDDWYRIKAALDVYQRGMARAAHQYLERGGQSETVKLVEGRKLRLWRDDAEAEAWLAEQGIDPAKAREIKSPAQAEKELPKDKWPAMAALVRRQAQGVTLAPADDPRAAIVTDGSNVDRAAAKRTASKISKTEEG